MGQNVPSSTEKRNNREKKVIKVVENWQNADMNKLGILGCQVSDCNTD